MESTATITRRNVRENPAGPRDTLVARQIATDVPCNVQERFVELQTATGGFAVETRTRAWFHGNTDILPNDVITVAGVDYRAVAAPKQGPF